MGRDLIAVEKIALETLIDACGIEAVLQALSEACGAISVIVATDQQDAARAKCWAMLEGALGMLSTKVGGL